MKEKIISVIIAFFAMIFSLNVLSCQGRASKAQLDSERTSNEEAGLGRLTNEEVENERKQNDEAGLGRFTNAELSIKLDSERTANEKAGLGRLTDAEVENEREANENAGLGRHTNAELEATKLKPQDVPDGYVLVEGGTFVMGGKTVFSEFGHYDPSDVLHTVTLSSFIMGTTEVTQKLYESVMGKNPSHYKGDSKPVESINWFDAVEFCNELSNKDGLIPCYLKDSSGNWLWNRNSNGWRLPTEAEWEYAARGGNKSQGYTCGEEGGEYHEDFYNGYYRIESIPSDVASRKPNELGLYDVSGNVREWCWDWYGEYSYNSQINPTGSSVGKCRVLRGGSCFRFDGGGDFTDFYFRYSRFPDGERECYNGFRIVRSAPISIEPKKIMTAGENLKLRSAEATSSEASVCRDCSGNNSPLHHAICLKNSFLP